MTKSHQIRILIVDDHPLLHEGLATVIQYQDDMVVVGEATSGREAVQRFRQHTPDVTLMDLQLPDMSGIDAIISIRSEFPEARVIVLSTFAGDVEIQRALEAGARAYLLKSMPLKELVDVICQVHAGRKRIPPEIAAHLAEDYIAEGLVDPRSRFSSRLPAAIGTAISPKSSSSPRKQKVH